MLLPTVAINVEGRRVLINARDFHESKHVRWEDVSWSSGTGIKDIPAPDDAPKPLANDLAGSVEKAAQRLKRR